MLLESRADDGYATCKLVISGVPIEIHEGVGLSAIEKLIGNIL